MSYMYLLSYMAGCFNGVCITICCCHEKSKIEDDNDSSNNELDNQWLSNNQYIRYLENTLMNLTPVRRRNAPNIQYIDTEASIEPITTGRVCDSPPSNSPSAPPMPEACILRNLDE